MENFNANENKQLTSRIIAHKMPYMRGKCAKAATRFWQHTNMPQYATIFGPKHMPSPPLARDIFLRLSRRDFSDFTLEALRLHYDDTERIAEGESIYRRGVRRLDWEDRRDWTPYVGGVAVYVNHFVPTELFNTPGVKLDDSELCDDLRRIRSFYREGEPSQLYLLLNSAEATIEDTDAVVLPRFKKLVEQAGIKDLENMGVGTFDSFMAYRPDETTQALFHLITRPPEEIAITVHPDRAEVRRYWSERPLFCGVTQDSLCPCEPVFALAKRKSQEHQELLEEFASIIKPETKESDLEAFIVAHYKDIFGPNYDQIESQLWLRFPELDIAGHSRRLDVLVRNSLRRDWELFEIKKPIPVTTNYRDLPVFAREVYGAIEQLRNYSRLLMQERVRDKLAKEGIEYYEPSLNLVIGKTPQLEKGQWRRLVAEYGREKILTWDELFEETKLRLEDRESVFKGKIANSSSKIDM